MPAEESAGKAKYEERKKKLAEKKEKEVKKKKQVTKVGLKGGERIKVVSGETLPDEPKKVEEKKEKAPRPPKERGKKYKNARAKVDRNKKYPLEEAIKLVKDTAYTKFDGTVEVHLIIKKVGFSTQVKLPYSSGRKKKIEIANEKTVEKLKKGKIDFDVLLATAEMMPKLVPFAKILGPKGLMPNPKNATLIKDKKEAKKFSANSITLKTEKKAPIIHTVVGKVSQKDKELLENTKTIIEAVGKRNIQKAVLTSSMGPGIKIESI